MALFHLDNRSLVRIWGADAKKLINDTLTCRFEDFGPGVGRWFALLSPQGKVLIEGLVTVEEGVYWFDIETSLASDFVRRMKMYRLRAKAEVELSETHTVLWSPDGELPPKGDYISFRDERAPGLGERYIIDAVYVRAGMLPAEEVYDEARIEAGIAESGKDFGANEVFPHDIGMDLLAGVDFKKGCYIGQEVVSRMQHRGTARRRPVIVSGLPDGAAPGASLAVGEREVGNILTVRNGRAVAIVRLDKVPDAHAAMFAGLPVELHLPAWATYGFGEAAGAED
jgi:tRNA-modifying protein YgfZ